SSSFSEAKSSDRESYQRRQLENEFPATVKLHVRSPKTGLPIRNIMAMDKPIPERITSAVLRNVGRRSGSCAKQDYPYAPLQSKSDAQWTPFTMRLIATQDLTLLNVKVRFDWQRGENRRGILTSIS